MPTYEYKCEKCGEQFELFQTFAEDPLKKHPGKCKGKVVKVMSAAGIVFSGSGFYKTDNKDSSRSRSRAKSQETASSASGSDSSSSSAASGSSSDATNSSSNSSSSSSSESKPTDSKAKAEPKAATTKSSD